jgi:hypothetical protein
MEGGTGQQTTDEGQIIGKGEQGDSNVEQVVE